MTETDSSGWSWKYVSFFKTQNPETPGSDATFAKKSDSEYAVDGPSYEQNGTRVRATCLQEGMSAGANGESRRGQISALPIAGGRRPPFSVFPPQTRSASQPDRSGLGRVKQ